jgi:hypothetical protein
VRKIIRSHVPQNPVDGQVLERRAPDFADFNHDGKWTSFPGRSGTKGRISKSATNTGPPTFLQSHQRRGKEVTIAGFEGALGVKNAYSEDFLTFTFDINGDGWADIVIVGFPGEETYWYENPQQQGRPLAAAYDD